MDKNWNRFRMILLLLCFLLLGNYLKGPVSASFLHIRKNQAGKKILTAVSSYEKEEGFYGVIYYTKGDRDYISFIKRTVDTYYPLLAWDFDIQPQRKPALVVYPDQLHLSKAIGINYNEKPPMGVYYGGVINVLSPDYWITLEKESDKKELFLEKGPIIHEMVHFFLDEKTGGNYEAWFTEGVALYYEYKYTGVQWRPDLSGAADGIALNDMPALFCALDEAAAYRCAFEVILDIVETGGENALMDIIASL